MRGIYNDIMGYIKVHMKHEPQRQGTLYNLKLSFTGLQIRCVFAYLRIEVVGKRSTLTDTFVKNAFVLGDRHLSYANSFHNNRQIRNDQDYSCISCEFSLSALLYIEHLGTWVVFTIYLFY